MSYSSWCFFLSCVIKSAVFIVFWTCSIEVVTTIRIAWQENDLSRPLPLWNVLLSHILVYSLSGRCVKIHLANSNITYHCRKEVRYDMRVPLGNFTLLKQYEVFMLTDGF